MILTGKEAREKLIAGVTQMVEVVKSTLGPRGRNVILDKEIGNPVITKDGVSVAIDINLTDEIEQIGARIVKEVAMRTSRMVGDGTTSSSVLAEALLKMAVESDRPIALKRELDAACEKVIAKIDEMTVQIDSEDQVKQVASISSNGDKEIGEVISEAIKLSGPSGIITVEQSPNHETFIESKSGYEFDRGFMSPYFADAGTGMVEMDNVYVFMTSESIRTQKELLTLMGKIHKLDRPCLIIANDVSNEQLATLVYNYRQGTTGSIAVKAPEFGDRQKALLEDMAAVVGAEVVSREKGHTFENIGREVFGKVDKVYIYKDNTILVNEKVDEDRIKERISLIKTQLNQTTSDFDREKLQDRLAKVSGGIVTIYVGGNSEIELREKKARVEDAMHATRAAMEGGIVPGGGITLFRARQAIEGDDTEGAKLLYHVLESPLRTIIENAGYDPQKYIEKLRSSEREDEGWNAVTEEFEPFLETGVIDPAKVTRYALLNAVSVVGTLLTTDAVVTQPVSRLEKYGREGG